MATVMQFGTDVAEVWVIGGEGTKSCPSDYHTSPRFWVSRQQSIAKIAMSETEGEKKSANRESELYLSGGYRTPAPYVLHDFTPLDCPHF
jgi:hypothetical protein